MTEAEKKIEKGEYAIGITIVLSALLLSATIYLSVENIRSAIAGIQISAAAGGQPAVSNQTQQNATVKLVVLSDKRCEDCALAVSYIIPQFRKVIPNLEVKEYDYSDTEGKRIYDENGIKYLPAFLFDESVKQTSEYANLQNYLVQAGEYYSLEIGAEFDPNAEICGNGVDDDKDGKTDCADEECKEVFECIVEKSEKPTAELFVMAFCPYGVMAENAMKPVVDLLGEKADVKVRFIANIAGDTPDSVQSLHGAPEAAEDLRQVCIREEYNQSVFWEYVSNINKNCYPLYGNATAMDACWKSAAEAAGVDTSYVENCVNTTAVSLLREDIDAADEYGGVSSSPTLFVNGALYDRGRTSEAFKKAICSAFNIPPTECNQTLSSGSAAAAPSGGCSA